MATDLSFLPDQSEKKKIDLSFLPDQEEKNGEDMSFLPDQEEPLSRSTSGQPIYPPPNLGQKVLMGLDSAIEKGKDILTKPLGSPNPEDPYASKGLEPGFTNQTPIEKWVQEKMVTRPAEAAAVLRPFISEKVAGTLSHEPGARDVPNTEENIIAKAQKTGKVPYGDILNRTLSDLVADNIPLTPTDFAAWATIGKVAEGVTQEVPNLFPKLGKSIGELGTAVKEWALTKDLDVPVTKELLNDLQGYMKGKVSPEVSKAWADLPVEERAGIARNAMRGEPASIRTRVKRFGGEAPAPEPINPLRPGTPAEGASFPIEKEVTPPEPPKPSMPKTQLNEQTVSRKGMDYLQKKFPLIADELKGRDIPLTQEQLHGVLLKTTAAGEEAILRGGTAEDAQIASIKAFREAAQPHVQTNKAVVSEGLKERAKGAAMKVLQSNKIDDQTVVNLVDHIVADNEAFKSGYGQEFNPKNYVIRGETISPIDSMSGQRLQTVINLANGATEFTGRHEAFHAVTNMLLDEGEQKVLLEAFGNHEKAADAFAKFQAGEMPEKDFVARIFDKIKQFLARLNNYFKARKFSTAEDIFEAVDEGKMAGRAEEVATRRKQYSVRDLGEEVEQKAVDKFGLTDDFEKAGFLLKDGRMVDFTNTKGGGGKDRIFMHADVEDVYKGTGNTGDLQQFLEDTGAVRLSQYTDLGGRHVSIEAHGPLTQDQLRQIGEYYDTHPMDVSTFEVVNAIGRPVRHRSVANPTGEDVARFFNGSSQYSAEERQPTFYSQLERVVEKKLPERAMPEQIKNIVNSPDVKKEEVEWSGINEWLAEKKGSVKKQEVLDFLKQNQVNVQEVEKSKGNEKFVGYLQAEEAFKRGEPVYSTIGNKINTLRELQLRSPNDEFILKSGGITKFDKYTLPGGENYRELLLTLPEAPIEKQLPGAQLGALSRKIKDRLGKTSFTRKEMTPQERAEEDRIVALPAVAQQEDFRSSHFSEPNILAHIRFNDRIDANGKKTLFIEEVQSDWHQLGREKGYRQEGKLPDYKLVKDPLGKDEWIATIDGRQSIWNGKTEAEVREQIENGLKRNPSVSGVPDAPFKKSWHELALKRMLRYAAENGYDKIAWTTGEQQAERYDLSHQVSSIKWDVVADGKSVGVSMQKKGEKKLTGMGAFDPDQLTNVVGKDLSKKINDELAAGKKGGKFSGLDLKVGGEGMKGFYDQIIPSFLNKYAKKWGGKVGETTLDAGVIGKDFHENKVHSLDITPAMKESVLQGQPLYSAEQIKQPEGEGFDQGFNQGTYNQSTWKRIKQELYDRFEAIKYEKGKEIAPEFKKAGGGYTRSYVMARLLNGKIRGISENILDDLNSRLKPLRNHEDRLLLNKIYTLRNLIELDHLGKTTGGVTAEQGEFQLANLKHDIGKERFDRISAVADDLADIQNNKALQILVDGKVISSEQAQILRSRYPDYLRSEIMDEILAKDEPLFRRADNGEPLGKINLSFLKTKTGTNLQINDDVIDIVRRSLVAKVSAAQKQAVIDQIAKDFGTEIGQSHFKEGKTVTEVDENKIPQGYFKSNTKASGGRIFAVRRDVAELLEGLNQKEADFITRSMSSYNRLFRLGATTFRVPFVFNNVFRDVQEALFKARTLPGQNSQIKSYVKGAFHALKESFGIPDKVYNAWKEAGGAYGGAVSSIVKGVDIPYRLESPQRKLSIASQGALALPFEAVARLAEFSENTSRLAEWIRLEGSKVSPELRALNARDITVDFEKVGDAMKRINQLIPFLNATIQGNVNNFRAFRDQPTTSAAKMAAYVMFPAILLYEWNKRFKNEESVDPYIKSNFWHLNSGMEIMQDGKKLPILFTIRKGEFASQISYFVDTLLEYANKDPNFKQKLEDFTLQGGIDQFVSTVVPPLARVPIEEAANRNFFTGRPIISMSLEDVESGKQFKPSTTDSARRLGEVTGISPARFEHVTMGLFPAFKQILEASDAILKPQPEVKRDNRQVLPIQNYVPVVKTPTGFFSQTEANAQRFEQKMAEERRTRNFLFEQTYRQYLNKSSDVNLDLVRKYAGQLDGDSRQRIMKKVNKEQAEKLLSNKERAVRGLPKWMRKSFQMEQMTQQ